MEFERHVLAFKVAALPQALAKRRNEFFVRLGGSLMKEPNDGPRRLLCARRKRPSSRCAAEKCNELAPPHYCPRRSRIGHHTGANQHTGMGSI